MLEPGRYDAVLFDLLTGLLDSWSLWSSVAGNEEQGRLWRQAYLRLCYSCGPYRDFVSLIREAAQATPLPTHLAAELTTRFAELEPWPETNEALAALRSAGLRLGLVTNCSESLAEVAAARLAGPRLHFVSAERAGHYKPQPQPYLLALEELQVSPSRTLFVAGSPYDLLGAAPLGMDVFWHNPLGLRLPDTFPPPLFTAPSLRPLLRLAR